MKRKDFHYRIYQSLAGESEGLVAFHFRVSVDKAEQFFAEITNQTYTTCSGAYDAEATVTAYGGTPPYSYQWDYATGQQTTETATGLGEQTYQVTITDAEGTTATASVEIEADPALFNYTGETTLTVNTDWASEDFSINEVIRVPTDIALKISNSRIQFGSKGKIYVEKGGKLIVANSKLVDMDGCKNMWGGIMVIGDESQEQPSNPLTSGVSQGFVWLKEKSSIENASTGIFAGDEFKDTRHGSGAVVWVDGSEIKNCRIGVEFKAYKYKTISRFNESAFICDAEMQHPVYAGLGTKDFVRNWGAKGLTFTNVSFTNTGSFTSDQKGIAFNSLTPLEEGTFTSCQFNGVTTGLNGTFYATKVSGGSFTNMLQGIVVKQFVNTLGKNTFEDNTFDNVREGIFIQGGYQDDMVGNTFHHIQATKATDAYGIYLVSTGAFTAENNIFEGSHSTFNPLKDGATYGMVVENSGKLGGIVFNNSFTGTDFGMQTQDRNDNLLIRCNTFSEIGTYGLYVYDGTLMQQGVSCEASNPPDRNAYQAGNEWFGSCSPMEEIHTGRGVHFDYYAHYRAADNSEATVPDCSTPVWKSSHLKICEVKKTSSSCESYLPGLPAAPPVTPFRDYISLIDQKVADNNQNISVLKEEIPVVQANTDGGNTEALIAMINDPSISGGKRKNNLLQASPMSTKSLLALIEADILSSGNLQIVLTANSPLPDEVIDRLAEMMLSAGTMNVITDAQQNTPQFPTVESLQKKIVYLTMENQLLQNLKISTLLKYNEKPDAKEALVNTELLPSKKALAEELIVVEELAESRQLIEEVLLESDDIEEENNFAELMNTLADLKEEGFNIHEIDLVKEEKVRSVANSGMIVAAKAEVVLELSKNEKHPHPIKKEDDVDKGIEIFSPENGLTVGVNEFVNLYPNPNNGNMEIDYNLPGDEYGKLIIFTIEGKILTQYSLQPGDRHVFITESDQFANGVYYYKVTAGDRIIVTDKLVIVK